PILFRVFTEHALNAIASSRIRRLAPPVDDRNPPAGGPYDGAVGELGASVNDRRLIFGALVFVKPKGDEDLRGVLATPHFRRDAGLIEAVRRQETLDGLRSASQILLAKRAA